MSKEIKNLIVKFLLKEANFDELQQLELWITNPKNEKLFLEYIKTNAFINKIMSKYDKEKAKDNIIRRIRKEKKSTPIYKKPWFKYSAAASILILITAGILFTKNSSRKMQNAIPIIVNNQIESGSDKATLTLETGEVVALEKGTIYQTQNASSNGETIIYNNNNSRELVYNYLTIPRGGQFQLTLSDGTQVWLNSETQLKYPVNFADGDSRQVELIYGEAYFDVSPSIEHNGSNFKVYQNQQEVEVLGTVFNIKAYKDETNIYTTLVEGEVLVKTETYSQTLVPSQQSKLDVENNKITIAEINVKEEIAWINGEFVIQHKTLKEIMTVLSRWYDMDVIFTNKKLEEVRFVGILRKNQNIVDILNTIKSFGVIKNYEINNKKIILK